MSNDLLDIFLLSLLAMANPSLLAAVTVMLLLPNPKRLMAGYLLGAYMTSLTPTGSAATAPGCLLLCASQAIGKHLRDRAGAGVPPEFMPKQNSALIGNRAGPPMRRRVPRLAICASHVGFGVWPCFRVHACVATPSVITVNEPSARESQDLTGEPHRRMARIWAKKDGV
jgi:hypothetical protein